MIAELAQQHEALAAALRTVKGVAVYAELASSPAPPAVFLAPPDLEWHDQGPRPSEATWTAVLVVAPGDRAAARLLALLPAVVEAIEGVRAAVVRKATAGTWQAGNSSLPCYFIEIEV